jgi:hypothetical protein
LTLLILVPLALLVMRVATGILLQLIALVALAGAVALIVARPSERSPIRARPEVARNGHIRSAPPGRGAGASATPPTNLRRETP